MMLSALKLLCQYNGRKSFAINTLRLYIYKDVTGIRREICNSARLLGESKDSDSSSDEEDNKKTKKKNKKKSSVQNHLNMLLASMSTDKSKGELKPGFSGEFYKGVQTAAKEVAETIGGDSKKTESELLSRLLSRVEEKEQKTEPSEATKPSVNLSELISGMKIDRTPKGVSEARPRKTISEEVLKEKSAMGQGRVRFDPRPFRKPSDIAKRTRLPIAKVNLFGEPPLGIFKSLSDLKPGAELSTWMHLAERELRLTITQPPTNVYEEMVHWTNNGMLWHFPINNEQGAEEEANVSFTEHVFLDQHLQPWCPSRGPIRHFMELVCVGLSKNPYFTVQEKKEHILWYRDYFMEKIKILEDVGLSVNTEEQTRIE